MKKMCAAMLLLALGSQTYAGFNGVTHHSRANCGNNESISWDWNKNWLFWVNSDHIDARTGTVIHGLASRWQDTWRNAMVHWGEGKGGWKVHGWHYMLYSNGQPFLAAEEVVSDCSIYDGWWDKNK